MTDESGGRLVGTSVQLTEAQREALMAIARPRQFSMADVIREAVREYLARQDEPVAA
jgi:predicted transcriptional regulator